MKPCIGACVVFDYQGVSQYGEIIGSDEDEDGKLWVVTNGVTEWEVAGGMLTVLSVPEEEGGHTGEKS